MKFFGREPALALGLLSAGLQMLTALFLPLTTEQVAAINSIAAAGLGVWTAFATRDLDGGRSVKAAALGFAQALVTLGLVFGVSLTEQQTASIMAFVALLGAVLVRQQSTPAPTHAAVATSAPPAMDSAPGQATAENAAPPPA
ncbi:hypothetical protein FXF51_22800 [Nonomuraea sp. PA05]|uniref:hypothetical protein n=1 Tax=Nonomuraea sp. PA05 TaxID=2604466 RepID=UPI0011DC259F|nr:hypothetical protein [Nonomuraea sp. PA05]TYB63889.1 hypothetical protein FXF51_22800 [Nonomuraea sp. PA05]